MKQLLIILSVILGLTTAAQAEVFPNRDAWVKFDSEEHKISIKDLPIYVNIMDDAREGCWTNIGEVRTYSEDKLAENGAVIVESIDLAAIALNFRILATRWAGSGWCYGSMTLSLNVEAVAWDAFNVNGSIYRKSAIDIEPQNFNISALTWLGKKLSELN